MSTLRNLRIPYSILYSILAHTVVREQKACGATDKLLAHCTKQQYEYTDTYGA